jgi:hypothetical protein
MKTINLFTVKNKGTIVMAPISDPISLNKLETNYMVLRSTDENNEYTGINITLVDVNPKSGMALFRVDDNNSAPTEFVIKEEDDPVVEFEDDLGKEYHVFDYVSQYEINQEIKQGGLYKFQNAFTNEWFLAVVQSVGHSLITLNKLDVTKYTNINPTQYELSQRGKLFSILASDTETVEKFKNYVVTELCDLGAVYDNADDKQ